jgi:hypothetical protein
MTRSVPRLLSVNSVCSLTIKRSRNPQLLQQSGAVYHVMNRGTARQATFLQEQDYEAFLKTLAEAHGQCFVSRNEIFRSTLIAV